MGFAEESQEFPVEAPLVEKDHPVCKTEPEVPKASHWKRVLIILAVIVAGICAVVLLAGIVAGSLAIGVAVGQVDSSASSSTYVEPDLGPGDCLHDSDCPRNSQCIPPASCTDWGYDFGRCAVNDCEASVDCASGEICMRLDVYKCIPAPCISDFDCPHGHCELYIAPPCSPIRSQMYCQTSEDACRTDDDCQGPIRYCIAGKCARAE
mmetsp:Transcript_17102/g.66606  ORF Transcript_17102/g.66606 Transcript_17102/m.66606 type:complete len:208 (-) Transcript_17102:2176-2799(-)